MQMQIIEKIRNRKKWSMYEMAKQLGISQTSLKHYVAYPPGNREKILINLQEISGLSVEDFWEMLKKEVLKESKEAGK